MLGSFKVRTSLSTIRKLVLMRTQPAFTRDKLLSRSLFLVAVKHPSPVGTAGHAEVPISMDKFHMLRTILVLGHAPNPSPSMLATAEFLRGYFRACWVHWDALRPIKRIMQDMVKNNMFIQEIKCYSFVPPRGLPRQLESYFTSPIYKTTLFKYKRDVHLDIQTETTTYGQWSRIIKARACSPSL